MASMRDIIQACSSKEARGCLLRRLSRPSELLWHCAPRDEVRRMYLRHRREIIGWLDVIATEYIDRPVLTRRYDNGRTEALQCTVRTMTRGPLHRTSPPVPHDGCLRSWRYFDFDRHVGELEQLVPALEAVK